jgi:hypothetical protein
MSRKKMTILITVGLVLISGGVYFVFFTEEPLISLSSLDTPTPLVERDSVPNNRIEMLKQRAQREKDSLKTANRGDSYWDQLGEELERDSIDLANMEPSLDDTKSTVPRSPKSEKEVVIKYVEVPVNKPTVVIKKPKPKPRRRREGFISESEKIVTYAVNRNPANSSSGVNNTEFVRSDEYLRAIIHDDQKVRKDNTVKLRLLEEGYINGILLEKNRFLYGVASMSNNRVLIDVKSVVIDGEVMEIDLKAYDTDGLEGVYIPGAVEKEIKDDVLNSVVSETAGRVNIPLVGNVGRRSAAKKLKSPVVEIPNGHEVILRAIIK